ncbi:MAG: MFS transporter [Verrucomicrobiaceae bacterium]|nr:MFS transporter [Verrucomicrobiaceae bacterium]
MQKSTLSTGARLLILIVAFVGWFLGGVQIGITNLAMRPAALALMAESGELDGKRFAELAATKKAAIQGEANPLPAAEAEQLSIWEAAAARWYAYFQCAFLFGAAAGGWFFGRLGDRIGRTRALGLSIICFSALTGMSFIASHPMHLLVLRFLACMGVGGCWPNGVALVSEAWERVARPVMASLIGMAGNVGIFAVATLLTQHPVTPESWRWVLQLGGLPVLLGMAVWLFVRESPAWLGSQSKQRAEAGHESPSVFGKSYRSVTLIGIALATVPLFGGWGAANWMIPWAGEVGPDGLGPQIGQVRSIASIIGSALAAVIALRIGRRTCYFLSCLFALAIAQYAYWFTTPVDSGFLIWVAAWGLFNGIFFGWLPFFLPELFETRIRATGAGVSFNFGRILTASLIFITPAITNVFDGNYAHIGRVTSLVFVIGMIAILFAPDTSKRDMEQ